MGNKSQSTGRTKEKRKARRLTCRRANSPTRAWPRPARPSCAASSRYRPSWTTVAPAANGDGSFNSAIAFVSYPFLCLCLAWMDVPMKKERSKTTHELPRLDRASRTLRRYRGPGGHAAARVEVSRGHRERMNGARQGDSLLGCG